MMRLVVGGDAVKDAALQQRARQLQVVGIHIGFLRERDLRRLLVRAFAQPDANALRQQIVHVLLAAIQIRLDDRSHAARVSRQAMQLPHEVERALGVGRAFHVDAHEVVDAHRVVEQFGDQAEGQAPRSRRSPCA